MTNPKVQVTQALKSVARNEHIKSYIQQSNEIYPLLLQAAKRFVTGEHRQDGLATAKELISRGYSISLEYIGENTTDLEECRNAKNEFLNLIEEMGLFSMKSTVSFDLSHIGLSVNPETAYIHLLELAKKANLYGVTLMISMEETSKLTIFLIFIKTTTQYPNVGITIQAHLYRSNNDVQELVHYPGKYELSKGLIKKQLMLLCLDQRN